MVPLNHTEHAEAVEAFVKSRADSLRRSSITPWVGAQEHSDDDLEQASAALERQQGPAADRLRRSLRGRVGRVRMLMRSTKSLSEAYNQCLQRYEQQVCVKDRVYAETAWDILSDRGGIVAHGHYGRLPRRCSWLGA